MIDAQKFGPGVWVLLHDESGEIPDEIARVLEDGYGYLGHGEYMVEVPHSLRDRPEIDPDGLREVHEDQMHSLLGDGRMTPVVPQTVDDAVSAYVDCAPLGDVRLDWETHRGWWFYPEDGRVDAIPLVPKHAPVKDIKDICLAILAARFGFKAGR